MLTTLTKRRTFMLAELMRCCSDPEPNANGECQHCHRLVVVICPGCGKVAGYPGHVRSCHPLPKD